MAQHVPGASEILLASLTEDAELAFGVEVKIPTTEGRPMTETKTHYYSFGRDHNHTINGTAFNANTIARVTADDPRARMLELFGDKWAFEYDNPPDHPLMSRLPIVDVPATPWSDDNLPWANEDAIFPGKGAASVEQARDDAGGFAQAYALDDTTPSAIEPSRVLVLDEDEQTIIAGILNTKLAHRITHGDTYTSEIDEIARITLTKRRLAAEITRINQRIATLTEPCVQWLADHDARNIRHDATGALVARDDTIRLAHRDSDWGTEEKAIAKDAAGEVLAGAPDTQAFVQAGWNHRRVESYYRDLYKQAVEKMLELPEAERVPVDPDDIIPRELQPFYRLVVEPRIKVNQ